MTILDSERRAIVSIQDVPATAAPLPLGAFFAFVTDEDPHSPVMLSAYDELVVFAEAQIPLKLVDITTVKDEEILDSYRLYSVPTLLWIRHLPDGMEPYDKALRLTEVEPTSEILMRHVGITKAKKLVADFADVLEEILV